MTLPEPPGFADLTKPEQIDYLQNLWDRIAVQADDVPVPASHLALIDERLAAYRRNPDQVHSAFDVIDPLHS